MKIARNDIAAAVVLTLAGSAAFGQNSITVTQAPERDNVMQQTPGGPMFSERVIPGWENGVYAFVGFGYYDLHMQVQCPQYKDGCNGDEVVNFKSGNHSGFDVGFGYRFNPYIALEATAALMNGGANTVHTAADGRLARLSESANQEASWDAQPLRLRLDWPLMTGLSVYGTAGLGIKAISADIGELDAKTYQCSKVDPNNLSQCANPAVQVPFSGVISSPRNRVYVPVSAGVEWWIFQSPDWAININYQPPQGPGPKFYRASISVVGALF